MGKLYTLDEKLLVNTPEIRVGETVYAIDNRKKTVDAAMKLFQSENTADYTKALKLVLGAKAVAELDIENMNYAAYQKLFVVLSAAMLGEEVTDMEARFRTALH